MKQNWLFHLGLLAASSLSAIPLKVPTERYYKWNDHSTHPGYDPFISSLTFRKEANLVVDQTTDWFDPDSVKQGDSIYLNNWYLDWFVAHVHDRIKYPYILISCDVDGWLPEPCVKKLLYDPKLAAWFGRNILFSYHPKIFQIPMGPDLSIWNENHDSFNKLKEAIDCKPYTKNHTLYMNHFPREYGDRKKIITLFENEPYCFSRNHGDHEWKVVPHAVYYNELATSTFVLSPLGLETDCVRTWEALLLDCIPIVEHTFIDALFDELPIVFVHDWEEINLTFLEKKLEELKSKKIKPEIAYFGYWREKIHNVQKKIQNNELDFCRLEATLFDPRDLQDLVDILKTEAGSDGCLIYKGALTALRPLQLVNASGLSTICLDDPWMDQNAMKDFERSSLDPSLLEACSKVYSLNSEEQFRNLHQLGSPVFLDLTYFRTSVQIKVGKFRHSLKNDLNQIYREQPEGSLLCGNMATHDYVREVLDKFSKESNVAIHQKGNFWFCHKNSN